MLELTVRAEVPVPPDERVMLVGLREAVAPGGETDVARLTVPAKPLRLVRVTVDCVEEPAVTVRLDGVETAKSVIFAVTWMDRDVEPLVAKTVTVYVVLVVELTVRVDVPVPPPVRAMLEGLRDMVRPEGDTFAESETVPVKPLRLVKVMVETVEEPD